MDMFVRSPDAAYPMEIPLRNPPLAAFWAWLIPGAGHFYQRRYAKGTIFSVCILGIYFFGLAIGEGKVVYASFQQPDVRYPYLCQVAVGLPALPALVQRQRVRAGRPLLWNGLMAPPVVKGEQVADELAQWHRDLKGNFELGTLYTMIAGLLNILVIYDAYAGPVFMLAENRQDKPPPGEPPSS